MKKIAIIIILFASFSYSARAQHEFHHSGESSMLNYDSLLASAERISESKKGREIIESCLEKYGGRNHLEKLENFQSTVKMIPTGRIDSVTVSRLYKNKRNFKFTRNPSADWESRTIKGNLGWFQSDDTLYAVGDQLYKTWLFSYLYTAGPLALIGEQFDDVRYGVREDDPLSYIYMSKKDSLIFVLGIDSEDFFIKSAEGIIKAEDENSLYMVLFEDYRKHDGYYFPGKFTTYSLGMKASVSHLNEVKVNIDMDNAEFEPLKNARNKYIEMLK